VRVICRERVAPGIALAGLAPRVATTGDEAAAALGSVDAGVVLIEQDLYDALPAGTRRQLRRDGTPIIMPFPSPGISSALPPEHELLEILRKAIGYRVRLR
jgi:vacuolar-type H+-ATPase subunit F/Vma7